MTFLVTLRALCGESSCKAACVLGRNLSIRAAMVTDFTGSLELCHTRVSLHRTAIMFSPQPIGHIRSPYDETAQVPKGMGATHEAEGTLEILPEFEAGLTDIEGFSHLIVIWVFDRSEGFELLGTPPSDNRPHGVFATRSPRRPNPIAFTVVELLRREGRLLHVRGVDMIEGTPILDIKPYLSSIPMEKLKRGWLAEAEARREKK